MKCEAGHEMVVHSTFKLDHEETDSARDTANLRFLESIGVDLGAEGTLWYCEECDFAQAEFVYPEESVITDQEERRLAPPLFRHGKGGRTSMNEGTESDPGRANESRH